MSTVADHFSGKEPVVQAIYDRLLSVVAAFGPFVEDPKKTSIHLNRKTAFAGVATRKSAIVLTIKSAEAHASGRIQRREQVSRNRWHLEVRLVAPSDLDAEVVDWLISAYALAG